MINRENRHKMNMKYYGKYVRPKNTLTDMAQRNFDEYLQDYVEIEYDELFELELNTHIRYISYDVYNKCELFRFGGNLKRSFDKYIVLKGRKCSFSVQRYVMFNGSPVYQTRFFKKYKKYTDKRIIDLQNELNDTINKANSMFMNKTMAIKDLEEKVKKLKSKLKKLNQKNINQKNNNQEDINQEDINQKDTNQDNINQNDINKMDINKMDINQMDINQMDINQMNINQEDNNQMDINKEDNNQENNNQIKTKKIKKVLKKSNKSKKPLKRKK